MAWHPLECEKGKMTLPWIWGGLLVTYLIRSSYDPMVLIAFALVYLGGSIVVAAHVHSSGKCD